MSRPSPTESATLYKIGTIKIGNDGNKWIISESSNGVKRWKLYKKVGSNTVKSKKAESNKAGSKKVGNKKVESKKVGSKKVESNKVGNKKVESNKVGSKKVGSKKKEIDVLSLFDLDPVYIDDLDKIVASSSTNDIKILYNKLKKNIVPELNKIGITTFIVPLPISKGAGIYWTDYAPEFIKKAYNVDIWDLSHYIYMTIYLDRNNEINKNRSINVSFTPLNKENKIKVINILDKYVKNNYEWNGSNAKPIILSYKSLKKRQ